MSDRGLNSVCRLLIHCRLKPQNQRSKRVDTNVYDVVELYALNELFLSKVLLLNLWRVLWHRAAEKDAESTNIMWISVAQPFMSPHSRGMIWR